VVLLIECEPCNEPGHICDQFTGKCKCPANTEGIACEKCTVGHWGFKFPSGCEVNHTFKCKSSSKLIEHIIISFVFKPSQPCNCSQQGSKSQQCTPGTGKCTCKAAYVGHKCGECHHGFYSYPECVPCSCDPDGTFKQYCNEDGVCSCTADGQCPCKVKMKI